MSSTRTIMSCLCSLPFASTTWGDRRMWWVCAALLCIAALTLSGCVATEQSITHHHYALGGPNSAVTVNNQSVHGNGRVLGIAPITVAPWLAGTDMYYRLAYANENRLAAYVYSDWVAPPAALLAPIIHRLLAANSGWQAVVGPSVPATVDATLRLRLENFSQIFMQPKQSMGVVEMTATLIDNRGGQVIAQKHFRVQVAAPTPDARGGVRALGEASRTIAVKIQRWIRTF